MISLQVGQCHNEFSHSLNSGSDRARYDCKVERCRLTKAVVFLVAQRLLLNLCNTSNSLKEPGIFCDLCALLQEIEVVIQMLGPGELTDVSKELFWSQMSERVFNAVVYLARSNTASLREFRSSYSASTFRFKSTPLRPSSADRVAFEHCQPYCSCRNSLKRNKATYINPAGQAE